MKTKLFMHFLTTIITIITIQSSSSNALAEVTPIDVLRHHTVMAHAKYEDALFSAKQLDSAINLLITSPTQKNLDNARLQWIKARIPYQQSETYLFGNKIFNDFNKKVNLWNLDEGLIDYVDNSYTTDKDHSGNILYNANIIANPKISVNNQEIDSSIISPELIRRLNTANNVDTNVTTGYHVIEFLLWGQDSNTVTRGAGNRNYTDFSIKQCTGGNCKRRADYLKAASKLLVSDLEEIKKSWENNGESTKIIMKDIKSGLNLMISGMTSLSYSELAVDRMNLGLILHDPKQEIDRFSDNTHVSYLYNVIGIVSNYTGEYTRINGEKIHGPSLSYLIGSKYKNLDLEIKNKLSNTLKSAHILAEHAEHVESYDQMISSNNPIGNKIVQNVINDLVEQTESIKKLRIVLDIEDTS
ncbi:MAG: peptidase [Candidatus Liberibacter europaeus]|uniref:Peptidase n=1 Tax=Candidatus Liberibacter europaeus TaxID=744859 RepID=A0A2T4VYQ3_9HYPH|nr:MAG: peptidase [Candidatus Liberibacter europaeus]